MYFILLVDISILQYMDYSLGEYVWSLLNALCILQKKGRKVNDIFNVLSALKLSFSIKLKILVYVAG